MVAIKIHKSSPCYYQSALEECEILQVISKKMVKESWNEEMKIYFKEDTYKNEGFCVRMLNSFVHFGPLGNHFCMVFEILGPSLEYILNIVEENEVFIQFKIFKKIIKQILSSIHFLHSECEVIHTDIRLDNFLFSLPYKKLEKIILEELEKEDKLTEFRTREIKRNIKLENVKQNYEIKVENLSKKERKKLRRKMKKMEKKLQKKKDKQIEVINEEKKERIKEEMKKDIRDFREEKRSERKQRKHRSYDKSCKKNKNNFHQNSHIFNHQRKKKKPKRVKSHDCKINFLKENFNFRFPVFE